MAAYITQRLLQAVLVLFVVSTLLFFLLRASGNPVQLMLGPNATAEQIALVEKSLGLDQPLPVQYLRFMSGAVRLQFGESLVQRREALGLVWAALPNTLILAAT